MTILFDKVLRYRCSNDVEALVPPTYDRFPAFEQLSAHREQIRAALWQFGGNITSTARYLHIEPARLRKFIREIDTTLQEDIERIDAALVEHAQEVLNGRADVPIKGDNVVYLSRAKKPRRCVL
jgi:hypothetical protein